MANVASNDANDDREIGKLLADAMEKVGKDGVITVDEGKSLQTETEWVEGMQFDRGYLSPYFVTDATTMEAVLENPYILVYEKKLTQIKELVPLLEAVVQQSRPLLIICEEVEGEAKVNVVAATESEVTEKKARVEDALHATRAAVQEGILPGGGVALLRASSQVKADGLTHDEEVGYNIVLRSCRSPLTMIAQNAGQDGGIVCERVLESKGNNGFNALTNVYEDLVKAGVIDPTKVARTALANAASVATLLLTSDALIAEKPKDDKHGKKAGHGGDYDMY